MSATHRLPRFASALSDLPDTPAAIDELCRIAGTQFSGPADLAVCFASHHHAPDFAALLAALDDRLTPRVLIGCTGESIVGVGRELEEQPALSLWLAQLPGATIRPLHLEFQRTAEGTTFTGWPNDWPATWPADATLILLGEPYSFPSDALLERLAEDQPGVPILGGMASGGHAPGENQLFLGRQSLDSGAVGVLIDGPLTILSIVSQGCRPIGRPMIITKAEGQMIYELSGRPAMMQLQEVFDALAPHEQQLVQRGLHVGRVINEYQERFGPGDFLVRNCIGADRGTGGIAIGDFVRPGQTVQFHVRDAQSADEDLRALLRTMEALSDEHSAGALLFTCNGRGTRLFSEPHHDAAAISELVGRIPLAGFFAAGEIGPVGGKNFLHGFTASIALFTAKEPSRS